MAKQLHHLYATAGAAFTHGSAEGSYPPSSGGSAWCSRKSGSHAMVPYVYRTVARMWPCHHLCGEAQILRSWFPVIALVGRPRGQDPPEVAEAVLWWRAWQEVGGDDWRHWSHNWIRAPTTSWRTSSGPESSGSQSLARDGESFVKAAAARWRPKHRHRRHRRRFCPRYQYEFPLLSCLVSTIPRAKAPLVRFPPLRRFIRVGVLGVPIPALGHGTLEAKNKSRRGGVANLEGTKKASGL